MNKWVGIGRLTKDPELNYAAGSGTAICRLTLAINRVKREGQEKKADFINCIAFGKTGETIAQYLAKGRQVAIAGRIQTGSYDANDGTKRYTTDIVVESFEFIGGQGQQNNGNVNQFDSTGFEDDMTPVDDGDMPF